MEKKIIAQKNIEGAKDTGFTYRNNLVKNATKGVVKFLNINGYTSARKRRLICTEYLDVKESDFKYMCVEIQKSFGDFVEFINNHKDTIKPKEGKGKEFTLKQLFSILDGRLSTNIEDVYDMLNTYTGEDLTTLELPIACDKLHEDRPQWFIEATDKLEEIKSLNGIVESEDNKLPTEELLAFLDLPILSEITYTITQM